MAIVGLLIASVLLILFFVFSNLPKGDSVKKPEVVRIENQAQEVMESTADQAKAQKSQLDNIDK